MPKAEYTLMAHQKKAVKFLDKMDGVGALLFEPGVGKTGSTLGYIDQKLVPKYGAVRVLVISPLAAADTWVLQVPLFMNTPTKARVFHGGGITRILDQVRKSRNIATVPKGKIEIDHTGDPDNLVSGNSVTIVSLSAGAFSNYCKTRDEQVVVMSAVQAYDPHLIVVDESHIIKAPHSNLTNIMYFLGALAPHRIILTGTVTPNSPLDVYGQWKFFAPWTFSDSYGKKFTRKNPSTMTRKQVVSIKPWSWTRFSKKYAEWGGYEGRVPVGYLNKKDHRARVAERSMVMTKDEALDLPPVTDVNIHIHLTPKERAAYERMVKELIVELHTGEELTVPHAAAKIMKLRQLTAGFIKDTDSGEHHQIGKSKWNEIKALCEGTLSARNRIVVFAHFRYECDELVRMLAKKGTTVEVITGKTKATERLAIRQRFKDTKNHPERTILVAQARTMSLSVNELVTAQDAIYASYSNQRADFVQSRGRLDRQGQENSKVTFWHMLVADSVDEVILASHRGKGALEEALLNYIKKQEEAASKPRRRAS